MRRSKEEICELVAVFTSIDTMVVVGVVEDDDDEDEVVPVTIVAEVVAEGDRDEDRMSICRISFVALEYQRRFPYGDDDEVVVGSVMLYTAKAYQGG